MKLVCIILQKKHRKYSLVRSPFLVWLAQNGHVQAIDQHGSPEGMTKVNRWRGRQSTPTPYTIPKRVKYIKTPNKLRNVSTTTSKCAHEKETCEPQRWSEGKEVGKMRETKRATLALETKNGTSKEDFRMNTFVHVQQPFQGNIPLLFKC